MKNVLFIVFVLLNFVCIAQVPTGIPYQAVARNAAGVPLINQSINIRFSIHDSTASGSIVYQEKQNVATNLLGMFNLNVGTGTASVSTFSNINWGGYAKFLQVELDTTGTANSFVDMGTIQMLAVPYAYYADKAKMADQATSLAKQVNATKGDMLYWNGTAWVSVPIGIPGQALVVSSNGVPAWGAPMYDNPVASSYYFYPTTNNSSYKTLLSLLYARYALTGPSGPGSSFLTSPTLDASLASFVRIMWTLQELPTDEAICAWTDVGLPELCTNNFLPGNNFVLGMYFDLKGQIAAINDYLKQTSSYSLSQRGLDANTIATIQQYVYEARFLRALSYYYAIDLFGNFEFSTEADLPNALPVYKTRAQLFSYVESELLAIEPNITLPKANEYGRADRSAVWTLLSKLYLNAEKYTGTAKYTECVTYSSKVISAGYALSSNYKYLFMADNNNNGAQNENIFPIINDGILLPNYGSTTFLTFAAIGGNMVASNYGIPYGWAGIRTRPEWVSIMQATGTGDTRNTIFTSGQTLNVTAIANFQNGYAIGKYSNMTSKGVNGQSQSFIDIDFPLFRMADVYLMFSEAVLRGGTGATVANALSYCNLLRTRAGLSSITSTQLTLSYILDERARELYWEGHRRTDLIRFDKFAGSSYLWQWKGGTYAGSSIASYLNVYPIPTSVLSTNSNMVQNPGY